MRHLWSLLAGLVAAPLAWLLIATGQHRSQAVIADWEQTGAFHTGHLIGPLIFLAVAGLMLGVLGTLRWSPAGPVAAGVLLILPTVFMVANPFNTLDALSYPQQRRFLWQDFEPWLPVANGTLLVLGTLLLVAMVSLQRWRRWPVAPAPLPPASDDEVVAGVTELTSERSDRTPMSDDEILAAAAAMDDQPAPEPVAPEPPPADEGPTEEQPRPPAP